ncbi:hypothetical protein ACFFRR_001818 [Megaselia abdita]
MLVKIVFLVLIAVVVESQTPPVTVVNSYFEIYSGGRYIYMYELSDGTKQFEIGYTRYTSDGTPYQVSEGYYIYKTPDDQWVRVAYFADKDGYKVIDIYIGATRKQEADKLFQQLLNKHKLPKPPQKNKIKIQK